MEPELDLSRLDQLQELLGTGMAEIVATLSHELTEAMARLGTALADEDLAGVAQAAHDARNSALMIDAQPLLTRLSEVEACARRDDLPTTRSAHEALADVWPSLRRRLAAATGEPGVAGS